LAPEQCEQNLGVKSVGHEAEKNNPVQPTDHA
jgi:hypothetical protein